MAIQIIIQGKDETGRAFSGVATGLEGVGKTAEQQGSKLKGFFDGVKNVALGLGGAAVIGLGAAGKAGLDFNNSIEQVTARLNAFTKDGNVTAQMLESIKKEAASTPFEFEEMAKATASLMSSAKAANQPVMDLVKQAEILAASNPQQGLEGAAIALREATGGDFTSLIERFDIPRQRLNELKAQGVPALEAVSIAMKEMGLDADLVSNMATTFDGRMSTLKDTFTNFAGIITQPIFDAVSGGLGNVNGLLDAAAPQLTAFAQGLATQIGGAIQWMTTTGVPMLIAGWESIQPALQQAQAGFGVVAGVIATVASVIMANLPGALAIGQQIFTDLSATVQERMAAIQAVISAVLPIILGFWAENGASIMATVQTTFTTVVQIISTVSAIINQLLVILAGFFAAHGTEITAILTTTWQLISGIITTALNLISGLVTAFLQLLKGDFSGAWTTIQETAGAFVTALLGIFESAGTLIGQSIDLTIAGIQDAWDALVRAAPGIGTSIIGGIARGISAGVDSIKRAAADAANSALKAAKEALGIHSPSAVFANLVGAPIAQGMALGMTQGMPMVNSAAGSLASAAVAGGQSMQIGGSVGVSLSMNGGLDRLIDAKIDNRMKVYSRDGSSRRLGS